MTTIQYRVFAWIYMLFESAIGGFATAFLVATGDVWQGKPQDLRSYLPNALGAMIVSVVFYLKRSPLPELLQMKKAVEVNDAN